MKKSILMITPENKEINHFRKRQINNFTQITMPYLAAFVDESQYEITLIDEYNQRIPYNQSFDLVVMTVNTANAPHCYDISRRFQAKGSKVAFGGPHATLLPEEVKAYCDVVMIGEAEESWPRFLQDFYKGTYANEYRSLTVSNLEGLPIPRRDLIKGRWFTKGAVFATRGCPYHCAYCNLKQIYHDSFRKRPIDEVIKDIQTIKSKFFVFWDDNFFGDIEYAKALLKELCKLNKKWAAQVTLERCKDQELLSLAKQAGCLYFFVGLESFSKETLQGVNKGLNNVDHYQELIDKVHQHGICIQAGIIFGFDTDTKEVFRVTLEQCNALGIDGVTVSLLTPLPKTPLYDQFKAEGRLLTEDWAYYNGKTRVAFKPKNMSAEELFEGYMWFRRNFYSFKSINTRLKKSKANKLYNLLVNLGYKISIRK